MLRAMCSSRAACFIASQHARQHVPRIYLGDTLVLLGGIHGAWQQRVTACVGSARGTHYLGDALVLLAVALVLRQQALDRVGLLVDGRRLLLLSVCEVCVCE